MRAQLPKLPYISTVFLGFLGFCEFAASTGQEIEKTRREIYHDERVLVLAICLILPSSSVHFSRGVFEVNLNLLQTLPAPAALSALVINDYLGAQRPY